MTRNERKLLIRTIVLGITLTLFVIVLDAIKFGPIDYNNIIYYSAPKKRASLASLDEVDPEIRATFDKLGIPLDEQKLFSDCNRMMVKLTELPQPVIARVHGIATAAGCQLVSMCDLAVASEEARFALPGVNVGVFCSTPAVGVVRNVGRKRAMEMLLTGELYDAKTALEWGLVNRVVPAGALDAEVAHFTELILARSRQVIANGKRTFYQQVDRPLAGAYAVAGESMASGVLREDAAEGIDAFLGKRPARWRE